MANKLKHFFTFKREIKPKSKPQHLIMGRMFAHVQVVCDFRNEMAAQRVKLLEKKVVKEGESVLDRHEKQIREKLKGFDELIDRQIKLAQKGGSKAAEPVAKELKSINQLLDDVESDLGGDIRTSIEKFIKKHKLEAETSSLGMNTFKSVRVQPGLFEDVDGGLDAKEVKDWVGLARAWTKAARPLGDATGAGTVADESAARRTFLEALGRFQEEVPASDPKEVARLEKTLEAAGKQYAMAASRLELALKKAVKRLDASISFVKKQKSEIEAGHNKKVLKHFAGIRRAAIELSTGIEAGRQLVADAVQAATKGGGVPGKIRSISKSLEKGDTDDWRLVKDLEKLQGDLNKLLRAAVKS